MKLVRVRTADGIVLGRLDGEIVSEIGGSLDDLIAGAEAVTTGRIYELDRSSLLAPLPESCRGLLCTGINYLSHQQESAAEFSASVPADPIFFFKTMSALTDPFGDLVLPAEVSRQFDWEVELGVVIGKGGRNIAREDAAEHIFGYTVVNDITARDLQKRHQQWLLGKNVDGSTPVGPWILTADEVGYPLRSSLSLRVNGQEKQSSDTSLMIFDVAAQIAVISRSMALRPGDVISTGTPSGVGFTREPPEFLAEGDVVEAEVEGVGVLRNTVRVSRPLAMSDGSAAPTATQTASAS